MNKRSAVFVILPFGIGDAIQTLPAIVLLLKAFGEVSLIVERKSYDFWKMQRKPGTRVVLRHLLHGLESDAKNSVCVDFNGLGEFSKQLKKFCWSDHIEHTCFQSLAHRSGAPCVRINGKIINGSIFFDTCESTKYLASDFYSSMVLALLSERSGSTSDLVDRPWPLTKHIIGERFTQAALVPNFELKKMRRPKSKRDCAILPTGSLREKRLPIHLIRSTYNRLLSCGYRPEILLGPMEIGLRRFFMRTNAVVRKCDRLQALATSLQLKSFCISSDSGPMHVGAAVGTPIIGIFGPTTPECWFPYPPPSKPIGRKCIHNNPKKWPSTGEIMSAVKGVKRGGSC